MTKDHEKKKSKSPEKKKEKSKSPEKKKEKSPAKKAAKDIVSMAAQKSLPLFQPGKIVPPPVPGSTASVPQVPGAKATAETVGAPVASKSSATAASGAAAAAPERPPPFEQTDEWEHDFNADDGAAPPLPTPPPMPETFPEGWGFNMMVEEEAVFDPATGKVKHRRRVKRWVE